jgi:hypothetical protein
MFKRIWRKDMRRTTPLYCGLVQKATPADLIAQRCLDHAAEIDRDARVRAIRFALYASRSRAKLVKVSRKQSVPPPLHRCQFRPAHRADSANAEVDHDA